MDAASGETLEIGHFGEQGLAAEAVEADQQNAFGRGRSRQSENEHGRAAEHPSSLVIMERPTADSQ
jgi:hypothetical protein